EAAQTAPVRVIPIGSEQIGELGEKFAFYTPFTIPAGTYPDMENDVETVTLKAMMAADAALPEEAVYQFCKTLFQDHLDAFRSEAAQTAPVRVIPIGSEQIGELGEKFAFYTPFTIPAGTYPDMENDVETVTLKAMMAADAALPEEAVYQFCKTLFQDHLDAF